MMKRTAILSLALTALAACGSSTNPDGGTATGGTTSSGNGGGSSGGSSGGTTGGSDSCGDSTDGGFSVVLTNVGVHPAAAAALAALNITPPSLSTGYHVALQAVSLKLGAVSLTSLGSVELTSANDTGPIEFDNISFAGGIASLGVISAVVADPLPDGGTPTAPAFPTCAQLTTGTGFTDYYVTAGNQVYFGTPSKNICDGVVFALPASYVATLDCAAGLDPTGASDLLTTGFALLYSSGAAAAAGGALGGVSYSFSGGQFLYYPPGYGAGSATATPPTTGTGVATMTGSPSGLATVSATAVPGGAAAGDSFGTRDLSTPPGSAYQVFFAPGT